MYKLRLMNVAQVRLSQPGMDLELRPFCVEVTSEPATQTTIIVMLSLFRDGKYDPNQKIDARLLGRFQLHGDITIIDPVGASGDGQCWEIHTPDTRLYIRPYKEEAIWIDPSFADPNPSRALKDLYEQKLACMLSLTAHERFIRNTPITSPSFRIHSITIAEMRTAIEKIDIAIKDRTKNHEHRNRRQ